MPKQYRNLTSIEFADLVHRHIALADWQEACKFMQEAYGRQAYRLETVVEEGGYYDDENYADCFSRLAVFDHVGNELQPDTSLPYWEEYLAPESEYRRVYLESDTDIARLRLFDHQDPPIPMKSTTYLFDQPPCEIPEVYILIDL